MTCPTCDHTMSRLGCQYSECAGTWGCPRCGTLRIGHENGHVDVFVPALVERCRKFQGHSLDAGWPGGAVAASLWVRLGLPEAIDVPSHRPPV